MITINFDNIYPPTAIENDFSKMIFHSPQIDGTDKLILVKITPHTDKLLPNVYNLGFGPPDVSGGFDDGIKLKHVDVSKLFSTVLFWRLAFLKENPGMAIGIDGSNDTRATLYHLICKSNKNYLAEYFQAIGVDWYVRIFRDGSYEADDSGNYIAKPRAEAFDYERSRHDLYRYYMLFLN